MNHSDSTPQIQKATEQDLPDIAALAAEIWRAYYPGIISNEQIEHMLRRMYSLEVLRHEISSQNIRYERLLDRDVLIGFASYGPADKADVFKLHKLYIQPDRHGQGLGSLLLRHCEREAARLGAKTLVLSVNKRNRKAIIAYERNGFKTTHSVVVPIGDGFFMDDYVLAKDLLSARHEQSEHVPEH